MKKQLKISDFKDGQWFKAKWEGSDSYVYGRIRKEDSGAVYLCQNIHDGSATYDKKGFRYSWVINDYDAKPTSLSQHKEYDIKEITLLSRKPAGFIILPTVGDYPCIKVNDETIKISDVEITREKFHQIGKIMGWIEFKGEVVGEEIPNFNIYTSTMRKDLNYFAVGCTKCDEATYLKIGKSMGWLY